MKTSADDTPAPSCPIHRLMFWRRSRIYGRCAMYGAVGVAGFFTIASLKCILLYCVLPALVAGGVSKAGSSAHDQEKTDANKEVPVSCPFATRAPERPGRDDAAGDESLGAGDRADDALPVP